MADGSEQSVGQTASCADGSTTASSADVGITTGLTEKSVATSQISAAQPFRLSQNTATQPNQPCDLALFIHHLPKHALAQGSMACVCQDWRRAHREHAWRFMVLAAGYYEYPRVDWWSPMARHLDMSSAHATVKKFTTAPLKVQQRAASSAESLTLKISRLERFLDYYEAWINLRFERLARLVIEGPTHREHTRGLPMDASDALRLGIMLAKLSHKVETLLLNVSFSDENGLLAHDITAAIVSSFPKLKVLGLPKCELPSQWTWRVTSPRQQTWHKVSALLECCHGLWVDVNTFRLSWLANVPRLERLHVTISNMRGLPHITGRVVFDCAPLFGFLAAQCPRLYFLHIHFEEKAFVHCHPFSCIPATVRWLVLCFEEVAVEGLVMERLFEELSMGGVVWNDTEEADMYEAKCIYDHLRPLVPPPCELCVWKGWNGGVYTEAPTAYLDEVISAELPHHAWNILA